MVINMIARTAPKGACSRCGQKIQKLPNKVAPGSSCQACNDQRSCRHRKLKKNELDRKNYD